MKKLLLAGFAVSALIAPAIAADMPVPAAPVATWTGFYVGVNAGYALSTNSSVNSVGLPNNCTSPDFGCIALPGFTGANVFGQASATAATFSTPTSRNGGFLGGGQFGYNEQIGTNSVIGLEADLQAMTGSSHSTTLSSVTPVVGVDPNTLIPFSPVFQTATVSTKLDFLGTIRARAGYLWTPELLLYITAGLAYGETEVSSSITQNAGSAPYTGAGSSSTVRFGGAAGAGLEWMLARNWSVRGEYLYVGLDNRGSANVNSTLVNTVPGNGILSSVTVVTSSRFRENIARAALNYHF